LSRKHFHIGAAILALLLVTKAKALTVSLVLSAVIAYLLDPLVSLMERKKIRRKFSVPVLYVIFLVLFISLGMKSGTALLNQAQSFSKDIPDYLSTARKVLAEKGEGYRWVYEFIQDIDRYFAVFIQKNIKTILSLAGQIIYLILIGITSFFLLLHRDKVYQAAKDFIGKNTIERHGELIKEIDGVLKGFFLGRLGVCFVVFLLTLGGTKVIGIKHGLFISSFTGFTAFIPYYGALGGLIPGLIAAFGTPPALKSVLSITILILVVNSIESNLLTPFMTGRYVKLHPGMIIVSVMVGGALYGFWGVVFSIPIAGIIRCMLIETMKRENAS